MGPGILGQLLAMPAHARGEHQDCLRCHAPLAEQADSLVSALETLNKKTRKQSANRAGETLPLHEQGLVCAACHVRKQEWFGPPRRDGSQPAGNQNAAPHGGWTPSRAFESSQFCAGCHQFGDDGYALNGKLLENTNREWQASRYAREGVTCQSCHMPDRRHLWRGIHGAEMVKSGVEMLAGEATIVNGQVMARLSVANTGVGHFFPTYVIPRVVVRGFQQNAAGHGFDALVSRVETAVSNHRMGLVAQASASRGAAARGLRIPGNAVLMVFRNDYAVRMLQATVAAGIEAPLRIYVTENTDGTASITYRTLSAVFAPYRSEKLDAMARELDPILEGIVRDAAGS